MMEWVESESLRTHMDCVAACMDSYCTGDAQERDTWTVAGLLHDFDYEKHPSVEEHPFVGVEYLRNNTDVGEEVIEAILGHATYSGVERITAIGKNSIRCR